MSLSRLIASRTFARTGRPTAQLAGVASAVAGGLAPLAAVELPAELQLCRSKMTFTKIGKTHGERATVVPHHPHPHAPHATGAADKPSLNAVLRKFWKLTHPDLFTLVSVTLHRRDPNMSASFAPLSCPRLLTYPAHPNLSLHPRSLSSPLRRKSTSSR